MQRALPAELPAAFPLTFRGIPADIVMFPAAILSVSSRYSLGISVVSSLYRYHSRGLFVFLREHRALKSIGGGIYGHTKTYRIPCLMSYASQLDCYIPVLT